MVFSKLFAKMTGSAASDVIARYLTGPDLVVAQKLLNSGVFSLASQSWQVNEAFLETEATYPQLYKKKSSEKYEEQVLKINDRLKQGARVRSYEDFATRADLILPRLFAPKIEGLEILREAYALALFARDSIHILCLSDPQVGVDQIIGDAITYHPVYINCDVTKLTSAEALWQGFDGKSPGILAGAHQGVAYLHRFEKLNEEQRKTILQLIDRGFLTFNSDGQVTRIPISTRIFGVVYPLVDSFVGKDAGLIKQQVPFDFSLTQHFHLTFLVQRNSLGRFYDSKLPSLPKSLLKLNGKLSENDVAFLKAFISAAEDREVVFSKNFQPLIVEWTSKLKLRKTVAYIHDITPNTIIAVIRLSQARARMKWRSEVALEDLKAAMDIVQTALEIT